MTYSFSRSLVVRPHAYPCVLVPRWTTRARDTRCVSDVSGLNNFNLQDIDEVAGNSRKQLGDEVTIWDDPGRPGKMTSEVLEPHRKATR